MPHRMAGGQPADNPRVHRRYHHPSRICGHTQFSGHYPWTLFIPHSRRWKEGLKPVTWQLVGFMGHNLWPLGTIHLPFTLTSHNKMRWKRVLIDFIVIWHPTQHNIILGRTTLFRFGAISSTIQLVVKFGTTEGTRTILATPPKELRGYKIMQPKETPK